MTRWSESFFPQSRLVWADCMGVPFNVWCSFFFMKLGSFVGESLFIDEDSSLRRRLDRDRIFILISNNSSGSYKVMLKTCDVSFPVKMEDILVPMDFKWLTELLVLKLNFSEESLEKLPNIDRLNY